MRQILIPNYKKKQKKTNQSFELHSLFVWWPMRPFDMILSTLSFIPTQFCSSAHPKMPYTIRRWSLYLWTITYIHPQTMWVCIAYHFLIETNDRHSLSLSATPQHSHLSPPSPLTIIFSPFSPSHPKPLPQPLSPINSPLLVSSFRPEAEEITIKKLTTKG